MNFTYFNLNLTYFNLNFKYFNLNLPYFNLNFTHFNFNFAYFNLKFTYFNLKLKRCRVKTLDEMQQVSGFIFWHSLIQKVPANDHHLAKFKGRSC